MQVTSHGQLTPLRRTIQPYVSLIVICAGFAALCIFGFIKTSESLLLWLPIVPLVLYGVFVVCFGLKYKVLWNQESVIMRASGGPERRIRFDEITLVRNEIASASDVLAQSRPFRRIAIYGDTRDPQARVDISLRHFALDEINQLLNAIGSCRPDLDIPTIMGDKPASGPAVRPTGAE
jgi:hypothetical protein